MPAAARPALLAATAGAAVVGAWWLMRRGQPAQDFAPGDAGSASGLFASNFLPNFEASAPALYDFAGQVEATMTSTLPRGIRNNNPGNLRPGSPWQGIVGTDSGNGGGYLVFDTPANGLRALAKLLRNYSAKGYDTIRAIITRYAPAGDSNDTAAYIATVSQRLNVGPDVRLMLTQSDATLAELMRAVIRHENGMQPYGDGQIVTAIGAAK